MAAKNPLLDGKKPYESTRSALDWARSARARGLAEVEAAWIAEAKRRGEIPDHSEPWDRGE